MTKIRHISRSDGQSAHIDVNVVERGYSAIDRRTGASDKQVGAAARSMNPVVSKIVKQMARTSVVHPGVVLTGRRGVAKAVIAALAAIVMCVASAEPARAEPAASDWIEGHNVRTRLIAGQQAAANLAGSAAQDGSNILAGLEMVMSSGWKTYWRQPGDAGGVPPEFDWSDSTNLASATVLYPAPHRMTDRAGSAIGYKDGVVFPVLVVPQDKSKPVGLKLKLAFGVCRDICVPSEGAYEVTVPASARPEVPEALRQAIERVPKIASAASASPLLVKSQTSLDGAATKLTMHVNFPRGTAGADVFVEGPPGEFVPLPRQTGKVDDKTLIFEIDLSKGADVAALKGKQLKATMVSDAANSEQTFVLE